MKNSTLWDRFKFKTIGWMFRRSLRKLHQDDFLRRSHGLSPYRLDEDHMIITPLKKDTMVCIIPNIVFSTSYDEIWLEKWEKEHLSNQM